MLRAFQINMASWKGYLAHFCIGFGIKQIELQLWYLSFATIRTPHHFTFIFGTPSLHHGPFIFFKINTQGFLLPRDSSKMTERISKVLRVAIPEWLPGLQGGVHLLCQHPRSHKGLKGLPSWPTSWMMTVDGRCKSVSWILNEYENNITQFYGAEQQ